MELVTRKGRAAQVSAKWAEQYRDDNTALPNGRTKAEVLVLLWALGPTPDPDEVDEIIGNGSWTSVRCGECDARPDEVVRVGEEPDYESATAYLCRWCAGNVVAMFDTVAEGE